MRRVGELALLVVQWALVVMGFYMIFVAVNLYALETHWAETQPKALPDGDAFILPSWQRFVQGMTTGLVAVGLGAVLFYLRRIYLVRGQ